MTESSFEKLPICDGMRVSRNKCGVIVTPGLVTPSDVVDETIEQFDRWVINKLLSKQQIRNKTKCDRCTHRLVY